MSVQCHWRHFQCDREVAREGGGLTLNCTCFWTHGPVFASWTTVHNFETKPAVAGEMTCKRHHRSLFQDAWLGTSNLDGRGKRPDKPFCVWLDVEARHLLL